MGFRECSRKIQKDFGGISETVSPDLSGGVPRLKFSRKFICNIFERISGFERNHLETFLIRNFP